MHSDSNGYFMIILECFSEVALLGIAVSTGSVCNSGSTEISHVLRAIRLEDSLAKGTIGYLQERIMQKMTWMPLQLD